jgi:hypothetical protein
VRCTHKKARLTTGFLLPAGEQFHCAGFSDAHHLNTAPPDPALLIRVFDNKKPVDDGLFVAGR